MSATFNPQDPIQRLVTELAKLPGIGEKTATRLSYFVLKQDRSYAEGLASALLAAKSEIKMCETCFTFTNQTVCALCREASRDPHVICVVERPSDVRIIEALGGYRGRYHVLHGSLAPLEGLGPDQLRIRELLVRLAQREPSIREVILATNPTVEGEATALYLSKLIGPSGIRVTKLAHGIPVGSQLEFVDNPTLSRAFENRMELLP